MAMKFILPVALLLAVLAIACNDAAKSRENSVMLARRPADKESGVSIKADSTAVAAGPIEEQNETPKQQVGATGTGQTQPSANPDWDKKIVKTADVVIEVPHFKAYSERLHQQVRVAGGYIAQEEQQESAYKIENTITIKVPVDRFDLTVMQLAGDSDKLVSKRITAEDVTMQLVDTKSRLETKKEVRQRYLELLKQAHSMKDILQVQNEINSLQEEMDGAAGRIAYLGHAASYSTINLNFYQVLDPSARNTEEPSFLRKLNNAFKEGWVWLSSAIVGLVGLWPLLLALLAAVIWWRKRPRDYAKSKVSAS
ncbi:MAG: DUF4349 domain-containing protein [Chitinophagaceae bacterium]|nr:DUF4349 domain-containing protein [Chitinophagaceae bacterium]